MMAILIILPKCIAYNEDNITINKYEIKINTYNEGFYIEEKINLIGQNNNSYNDLFIWIDDNAYDIKIILNENELEYNTIGNGNYSINISNLNISDNTIVNLNIQYYMDIKINEFKKILPYNTVILSIDFNDVNIFKGSDLSINSDIILPLYKPSEAPISSYLFAAIFLIVLLVLMSTYYMFRKQKSSKIKNISGESKELLSTKKLLIMSILKQLEKEYRAKKISDNTYNKLRAYYKQEAVDSMKKLEDIDSEII